MNLTRSIAVSAGFIAASAAIGVWAYLTLPAGATIAMHINGSGQMDRALPKAIGVVLLPAISVGVTALLALLPRIIPDRKGLEASAAAYGLVMTCVAGVLLAAQGAVIAHAIDPRFDVLRWVLVAVGVMLVLIGNFLGKVRHNHVLGIRTPWTLADPRVWDKTHRFTGRLMFLAGLILAAGAMLVPGFPWLVALVIAAAAGPCIAGVIYSRMIRSLPADA